MEKEVGDKIVWVLLGLVAIVAILGLVVLFTKITVSGGYFVSGGGRWYYGSSIVQYSPRDACALVGGTTTEPVMVYRNPYGTVMVVCVVGENFVEVPLVQTVKPTI